MFHACKVPEEIPDRFDVFAKGCKPVVMSDDATQPFPDTLLGIALRRVGGLSLEYESPLRLPDDGVYRSPPMLFPPVMDDQQPFAGMIGQQVLQELRKLPVGPENSSPRETDT
jgi:hypothetical protein